MNLIIRNGDGTLVDGQFKTDQHVEVVDANKDEVVVTLTGTQALAAAGAFIHAFENGDILEALDTAADHLTKVD